MSVPEPYSRRSGGSNRQQYVTPSERQSLLAELGQRSGQAIEALGLVLDTPGAIARGIIAGDPLSGFTFDRDTRVTGEELLGAYGLKPDNPYLSTPAGFVTEVALDPLAFATFALKSGGAAANAARKAGLTQYAPYVASLKAGSEATRTGAFTMDAIKAAGLKPTTSTLSARPLVGQRLSQMTTTLDEVVKAAPDPTVAFQRVRDALGNTPYDSVKDERIGGLFGISNPFTGDGWAFNPNMYAGKTDDLTKLNWAEGLADRMDRLGQGIAWSYPARLASSAFDKSLGGRIDTADQIYAIRRSQNQKRALDAGRGAATVHALRLENLQIPDAVKQTTGVDNFFSAPGAEALTRLVEGKPLNSDLSLLTGVTGLDNWIVQWRTIAQEQLDSAKALGLKSSQLQDPFGLFFSPRSAPELDFDDMVGGPVRQSLYSANINNQIARNRDLMVPGGTFQLQQIWRDPRVTQWRKGLSTETEESIGQHIADLIAHPLVDRKQGIGIARVFGRAAKDLADDQPIFGTHPLIEQMGYIVGEGLRRANAESAYEALADAVVIQHGRALTKAQIPGGKHISLAHALDKIGQGIGLAKGKTKSGRIVVSPEARALMKDLVAKAHFAAGTNPSAIKLSMLSVPESTVNRILKVTEFYSSPEVQKEVGGLFNKFTTLFKASVLAWPSRFTRDMYSNIFSVWLENGSVTETLKGTWAASKILNNDYESVLSYLRQIPRYSDVNLTDAQIVNQFKQDVGRTGILSGLATTDLLSANRRGDIGQFVPGSTPISISRSLGQLKPESGLTMSQRASDFFTIKGVTTKQEGRNKIFQASNMLGDTIDSMGRLGGFMSLMRQGVAPEEASRRMMSALVDYSSLTPFERTTIRDKIFPWWAYTSRIGKYVVQSLMENPGGRYGQTIRAINDLQATTDERYIPTALRQRFALRLPEALNVAGNDTYLTDIDLPGVDVLNMVRLGYQPDTLGSILQTGQATTGEILQQANPLIRTVAELATGTDFYSKKPLEQANTAYDKIYAAATGNKYARVNPLVRAALSNIPLPLLQRSVNALGSAVDPRVPDVPFRLGKTLINNLTGVKIQNVDPEYEYLDAMNKIKQQLAPYNREFVQSYVPKEQLPNLPLESQRMNALYQDLQRSLRDTYQRKFSR
jgi:hypothetical protein